MDEVKCAVNNHIVVNKYTMQYNCYRIALGVASYAVTVVLLVAISGVAISLLLLMLLLLLLLLLLSLSSLLLLLLHLSLDAVVQSGVTRGYSFIIAVVVVFPLMMLPLLLQ